MRNPDCQRIELAEMWGFICKTRARLREDDDPTLGDVWTYYAIGAETKLVPSFKVASKRILPTIIEFISNLASSVNNRIQISSDAMPSYGEAI